MKPTLLLQKLIDIERSIGIDTDSTPRRKVLEAQEYLLRLQGERLDSHQPEVVPRSPSRFALLRAFSLPRADGE